MIGSINPSSIDTRVATNQMHMSKAGAVTKGFPGTANAQQVKATVAARAFHYGHARQVGRGSLATASLFKNESRSSTGVSATNPPKTHQSMFVGGAGEAPPLRSVSQVAKPFDAGMASQYNTIVSVGMNSTSF